MPRAKPDATIGPINGDINIAPMMTAVELTFSPIDAMKIAHTNIQKFAPEKEMLLGRFCKTVSLSSSSLRKFKSFNKNLRMACVDVFRK